MAPSPKIDHRQSIPLVTTSAAMTPDWFHCWLTKAGLLDDAELVSVDVEPVTGGLIARMVRARLTYNRSTAAPSSVVVKFPTDDPGSLALAQAMGMYELETRFYQDIAPLLPATGIPICYLAELSDDLTTFNLVLEDLTVRTRAGDVLTTASIDECERALIELVNFQAPLWNSARLASIEWLANQTRTIAVFDALPAGLAPFIERFGDHLDQSHIALFESIVPQAGRWVRSWKAPTVLQHGDFRSDNLLFPLDPDDSRVTVLDFQTVRLGPPGIDPAYYLGASLSTTARRAAEHDLITRYHQGLLRSGVEDFDFDACWESYREGALYGVMLFVGMASQVESTERGDRVIVEQARRYADMAIDLDSARAANLA